MRILLAALSATLLWPVGAGADRRGLKMGTAAPEDTPWANWAYRIRKLIHKKSKNKFKVKIYLGSALGDEKSLVRQCEAGTIQMIGVSTGSMSAVVPEMQILELPFLFRSPREADKVLDALFDDFARLLAERGFVLAYWSENGERSFANLTKPIRSPADLVGLNMRSQESQVHVMMYEALGASPKALPVTEVLPALKNGQLDGFDNTPLFTFAAGWHEGLVQGDKKGYFSLSRHIYQPAAVLYSKKWWDSVPEHLRAHLIPARRKLTRWGRLAVRRLNKPLLRNFVNYGIHVVKLTKKERRAFAKATRGVYARFRATLSEAGKALYDKVMAKLREIRGN